MSFWACLNLLSFAPWGGGWCTRFPACAGSVRAWGGLCGQPPSVASVTIAFVWRLRFRRGPRPCWLDTQPNVIRLTFELGLDPKGPPVELDRRVAVLQLLGGRVPIDIAQRPGRTGPDRADIL